MKSMDLMPETALEWHRDGRGAALATVVETWGSAPRRVGSQMAISGDGRIAGSVSGGCVEAAVVVEAQERIQTGDSSIIAFSVSNGDAFSVGLACGGRMRVLIEPVGPAIPEGLLSDLVGVRCARKPVCYGVDTKTWARRLYPYDTPPLANRFRADQSGFDGDSFFAIHNPPLRLIVVGGVHIAQVLVPMAQLGGFDVTVIDPRESFASRARFPDTEVSHEWPDVALGKIGVDARTAVVTLSHDPKIDDPAMSAALQSDAFYLGSLGSRRTHDQRLTRLRAVGLKDPALGRIHAPIGLNIGAQTPAEIATAILAEITQTLRGA